MMRFLVPAGAILLLTMACSGTAEPSQEVKDENWWRGGNPDGLGDVARSEVPGTVDVIGETALLDLSAPVNTAPSIGKLSPISLDQGKSTTLDLNPFLSDEQDPDSGLTVSWHAKEVALLDSGDHLLYVVAPTTWFGAEMIPITVTDSGGLEAVTELKVIVQEIEAPEPLPPIECPETAFSLDAGKEAKEVLVSGNFNNWGSDNKTATLMTDPDGDGIFTVEIDLAPGTYQYKFIVDGDWKVDPKNPDQVDNGYGGKNSVLTVPACEE